MKPGARGNSPSGSGSSSCCYRGCILFSQYYDTVRWIGDDLAKHPAIPSDLTIDLYAGSKCTAFSYSAPIPSPESSSGISRYCCAGLRLHAHVDQGGQG